MNCLMRCMTRLGRPGAQLTSPHRQRQQSQLSGSGEKCLNQVVLLGRVGSAPQERGSEDNPVVVFSMATNSYQKTPDGEVVQHAQWHRISVFRPLLRNIVYNNMCKGQRLLVRGSINYFNVQDNLNNTSKVTTIVADEVIFLSPPNQRTDESAPHGSDE